MAASVKPVSAWTTADLMNPRVITISEKSSLREAAEILHQNQIGGAPVVDVKGSCVGMLSAHHFVRWAADGAQPMEVLASNQCPFLVHGRLLTGQRLAICILEDNECEFQKYQPTLGGRHTAVCTKKPVPWGESRHRRQDLPQGSVARYMDTQFIIVQPETPLPELARLMLTAHVDRVVVVDQDHQPLGIVTSFDLLNVLAPSATSWSSQASESIPNNTTARNG